MMKNDNEYNALYQKLKAVGQTHLLRFYDELDARGKKHLGNMIDSIDFSVISSGNLNSDTVRGAIAPLAVLEKREIEICRERFERIGIDAIRRGKVGAVLLAGGQGTRLGSDLPKGMFNIGETKDLYIFEMIIRNITETSSRAGVTIPLYVMTSDKNHELTVNFFEEKEYFGYNRDYITFFKQEMSPATDFDGKVYLEDRDRISMSPNGNGGWFFSMKKSGILDKAKRRGVEYFNVFAVDNVLQKIADPLFVGAVMDRNVSVGSKVVRKVSKDEKVGVMCLEDGKPSIVEYYELTDDMKNEDYDFGVILNYLFKIDELEKISADKMPVHMVKKKIPYIDEDGNHIRPEVPNGYKYETLVLDMIRIMDSCLPFEVERNREFAPIKNRTGIDSVDTARELLKENGIKI